jgi:hypothetical protein
MSRRPLIGACLCTIALVTVGCSDGSKGAKSASTDKPGAVSTAKTTMSTNVKTGNGASTTMKAGIASRTLRPVGVGQPAELAHNLFASVTHVEVATLTAQAPGETSGPGAFVTVTVRNDTDAAVDLGGLAVNVHYGNRIPATPVRELGGSLKGVLAPGGSKSARYAFRVPREQIGSIVVDIQHSAAPNIVIVDTGK